MEPGAGRPSPSGGTVLRRNRHSAMKTRLPDESSFGADCCPSIGIPPPPPPFLLSFLLLFPIVMKSSTDEFDAHQRSLRRWKSTSPSRLTKGRHTEAERRPGRPSATTAPSINKSPPLQMKDTQPKEKKIPQRNKRERQRQNKRKEEKRKEEKSEGPSDTGTRLVSTTNSTIEPKATRENCHSMKPGLRGCSSGADPAEQAPTTGRRAATARNSIKHRLNEASKETAQTINHLESSRMNRRKAQQPRHPESKSKLIMINR